MENPRRLRISFSGGETSAYMAWWILQNWRDRYDDIRVVFANTGQENEETLEFVERCDRVFGLGVVWVEAITHHNERKTSGHKIVSFDTASRRGEPFEDAIKKYGIPNQAFSHCTDKLKAFPMQSYSKSIGWATGTYDTAIGIRADEYDRMSAHRKKQRLLYPLVSEHKMTKPSINEWWAKQPFRLNLKGYQGNCKWCWKKSLRKHFTIISENPEFYDFPREMEKKYGTVGPEFRDGKARWGRRTFFRGNMSTDNLFVLYEKEKNHFAPADDDSQNLIYQYDLELDALGGCGETCEPFADEN